jgi:hypothetical protein
LNDDFVGVGERRFGRIETPGLTEASNSEVARRMDVNFSPKLANRGHDL